MNTTNINTKQSAGFLLYLNKAKSMPNTSRVLFRDDEKLIYTRRLQILNMLIKGYSYPQIEKAIGCSRNTISQVKKQLGIKRINKANLEKELGVIFK